MTNEIHNNNEPEQGKKQCKKTGKESLTSCPHIHVFLKKNFVAAAVLKARTQYN